MASTWMQQGKMKRRKRRCQGLIPVFLFAIGLCHSMRVITPGEDLIRDQKSQQSKNKDLDISC